MASGSLGSWLGTVRGGTYSLSGLLVSTEVGYILSNVLNMYVLVPLDLDMQAYAAIRQISLILYIHSV